MEIIDCVGPDQKQTTSIPTHMTLDSMGATDPWIVFLYGLKAPATREKYIQRLTNLFPTEEFYWLDNAITITMHYFM